MKRFLPILFFSILLTLTAKSQSLSTRDNASEPTAKMVKFFPNPAVTFINIEFTKSLGKDYNFQVYNFLGKKVAEFSLISSNTRIDLSNYNRGVYIFQLKDNSGKVLESGKFQVEK
ncbi:MAG: T9SS type A sorting domain-containing protein [Chitinophagaceae bacterium]